MNQQVSDQTVKGCVLALITYICVKLKVDTELLAICMPLISAIFAWLSMQIGDPTLASIFDDHTSKTGVLKSVKNKLQRK